MRAAIAYARGMLDDGGRQGERFKEKVQAIASRPTLETAGLDDHPPVKNPKQIEMAAWSTSNGGDWESLRGSDSASQYYPGKPQGRVLGLGVEQGANFKGKQSADQNAADCQDDTPRPYEPSTGVHQDLQQTTPYRSIIAEKLANTHLFDSPPKYPYKEIVSICFCWLEDFEIYRTLIHQLKDVLYNKYGCRVLDTYEIQHSPNPHAKVCEIIEDVLQEHSHHETLIVVYYIGGAKTTQEDGMAWFPFTNRALSHRASNKYPKFYWEMAQRELQKTESDVLIMMDTCGCGGDTPTSQAKWEPGQGKTELLASFEFETSDTSPVSTGFTQLLINELKARCEKNQVFSAADLHSGMISAYNLHRDQRRASQVVPFFMKLSGPLHGSSILLKPLAWPEQVAASYGKDIIVGNDYAVKESEQKAFDGPGQPLMDAERIISDGPSLAVTDSSRNAGTGPSQDLNTARNAEDGCDTTDYSQRTVAEPSKPSNYRW